MNKIEQFISDHRLNQYPYGILFNSVDGLVFLDLLKKHNRVLYGFDGFHMLKDGISQDAIQIDQAYSPDYSKEDFETAYKKAVDFLDKHREENIGYEFAYEKRGDHPFRKCLNCGHAWLDHYKLMQLNEGTKPTPKHMSGVCKVKGCDCTKFSE